MRRFILGIVMLVVVPAYTLGQQRGRSERSATERTAVPRQEAVHAARARQTDRRAEARAEATPAALEENTDNAGPSRERHRASSSAGEPSRGRRRDDRPEAAAVNPGFVSPLNSGFRSPLNPGFRSALNPGFRTFPDPEQGRTRQGDGDYRRRHRRQSSGPNVVLVPYALPVVFEREVVIAPELMDEATRAPMMVEPPSPARLILDVHPPTAQIFADGYYIGMPEDFRFEDGGAVLEPGLHRIDILERDYQPVSFDVNLTRGQTATFRQMLAPLARAPQPAPDAAVKAVPAAKPPATFYLVPGCYMGNVPPKEANLPATCDVTRALSFQY